MELTHEQAFPIKHGWLKALGRIAFCLLLYFSLYKVTYSLQDWAGEDIHRARVEMACLLLMGLFILGFQLHTLRFINAYLRRNMIGYDQVCMKSGESDSYRSTAVYVERSEYSFDDYCRLSWNGHAVEKHRVAIIVPLGGWFRKEGRIGGNADVGKFYDGCQIWYDQFSYFIRDTNLTVLAFDSIDSMTNELRELWELGTDDPGLGGINLARSFGILMNRYRLSKHQETHLKKVSEGQHKKFSELMSELDSLKKNAETYRLAGANLEKEIQREKQKSELLAKKLTDEEGRMRTAHDLIYQTIISIAKSSRFKESKDARKIRKQLMSYLGEHLPPDDPRLKALADFKSIIAA